MGVNLPFLLLGAAVIAAFVIYVRGRTDGAKLERAKTEEAQIDAIHDKKEKDDEVANLGPADLDSRFDKWVR